MHTNPSRASERVIGPSYDRVLSARWRSRLGVSATQKARFFVKLLFTLRLLW